ncbi:cell wall hydrolase [Thermaurantiacus sp.]
MNAWKQVLAAGSAFLLIAGHEAPLEAELHAWLTTERPAGPEVPPPPIPEDEAIAAAALVAPPLVETWPEAPPSLRALVAEVREHARRTPLDRDMECLARAVYWEAKGEPLEGQLAVAEVILNRVERGRFGPDICAVIRAPGQFSFVRGHTIPTPPEGRPWDEARAIAWIALAEAWAPIIGEATHFHARHVNPGWRLKRVAAIGNHIFYR